MSGGFFNHEDISLMYSIFGSTDRCTNRFEDAEISELVFDVFKLIHSFDYYKCSDCSREDYLNDKNEFKKKWFGTSPNKRHKKYIDESVEHLRDELYEMINLKDTNKSS